jgi:hypothetical protein
LLAHKSTHNSSFDLDELLFQWFCAWPNIIRETIHLISLIGFDRHLQPSSNYYMLLGVLKEIARKVRDGNYGNKPT